jgi:hypothetical protein
LKNVRKADYVEIVENHLTERGQDALNVTTRKMRTRMKLEDIINHLGFVLDVKLKNCTAMKRYALSVRDAYRKIS